jgi:hypothetical protein
MALSRLNLHAKLLIQQEKKIISLVARISHFLFIKKTYQQSQIKLK